MSPARARLAANLFTAAVIASIGVALAGTTWRLLGDPGQRLAATPVAARPAPPPDIATIAALSPFGAGASIAGAADANVVLRGILLARPRSASSALVSVGGATPTPFYVGSALAGGTIDEIDAEQVILAVGGERRILTFPDKSGNPTPPNGAASPAPASNAPAISAPPPPPPSAAAPAITNPQALLAGLGATPAADGFHVNAPNAQMRMAGLQPGDVIQRVNGMAMVELMANPASLQSAFTNGTMRVDLIRAGQPLTLSLPLR